MINTDHVPDIVVVAYAPASGSSVAACHVDSMLRLQVMPHYFAPSTRQANIDHFVQVPPPVEEPELESPDFVPAALNAFAAGGFERKNRWAAGR